jgi:hypothetical protein
MDLDPVLDLYPVQDPFCELKTTEQSGVVNFFLDGELVNCPQLQLSRTALSTVFPVCFLGIPVFFNMIFRTKKKFSVFCTELGKKK